MTSSLVYLLASLTLVLAVLPILWVWRGIVVCRVDGLMTVLTSGALLTFVFLAGTWAFLSYYLRFAILIPFVLLALRSYRKAREFPFFIPYKTVVRRNIFRMISLAVFFALDALVVQGYFYEGRPVKLSFPLRNGVYVVLQGGGSRLSNFFHAAGPDPKYALDITKLNLSGNRAKGIAPNKLPDYVIFGEPVYSPCQGTVVTAVDGWPDNTPGRVDMSNPAGNHVIIRCKGGRVLLAHLQEGSLVVKLGDSVAEGKGIGQVGNSGNTAEPHLHISAEYDAPGTSPGGHEAAPMLFSGRFLSINSVFWAREK